MARAGYCRHGWYTMGGDSCPFCAIEDAERERTKEEADRHRKEEIRKVIREELDKWTEELVKRGLYDRFVELARDEQASAED